ncbi:unnamed protein product [Peronospora belbahrii]|uniref:tRNA-guanine(15) transglycosylase-like domain-containing protein n=1 Tax=Peronospora belbahrii TaxID=622444 RepID=A0ABN8D1I0_9STRA|nr:unnamed protein product [Peronospora belbahrii]
MVSLSRLCHGSEHGIKFESSIDGATMVLRPEASIAPQNEIGADLIMALDDVASSLTVNDKRFQEACERTVRWLDRCLKAHANPEKQNLFGIVQGGLDLSHGGLRDQCLDELIKRDLPGYAIGGLAGGELKDAFWKVVAKCTAQLPENKPRFGTAIVPSGLLKLKSAKCEHDERPIDDTCECFVCKKYTRAYLRVLLKEETFGESENTTGSINAHLITYHNVTYMLNHLDNLSSTISLKSLSGILCYSSFQSVTVLNGLSMPWHQL